jgi:hypothetical protein
MTKTEIIVAILSELRTIASVPLLSIGSKIDRFEFPHWISAGDGTGITINSVISNLIWDLAGIIYQEKPAMAKAISRKDWAGIVKRVMGPLLGNTDLDAPSENSASILLIKLQLELANTKWNYKKRTFLFGCSFIQNDDIPPMTIGPVTVWKREKWLDQALENGRITKVSHQRLLARWTGKSLKTRQPSRDSANENAIVDAVGEAPYICAVETNGIFGEVAKEKAVMAARFALLGVALLWERPVKAMEELNLVFDGPPYRQTYAFFLDRPEIFGGSKWVNSLHGRALLDQLWEPMVQQKADLWKTLAEAIAYWLSPDGKVPRPKLMNPFVQALIWFHEACREPMPMIATTKFMAALDALASGDGHYEITTLVTARLGVARTDPIRTGGRSFSKAIENLYRDGRSRVIHGVSDCIGHDWQDQKDLAESLACHTLIHCLHWAAENPSCDDPKLMSKP